MDLFSIDDSNMTVQNHIDTVYVFIDAATSPQRSAAIGAYIYLEQQQINKLDQLTKEGLSKYLACHVNYKKYISNKSTWSEIKTAIHTLNTVYEKMGFVRQVVIYTDCQNLCDLMGKRKEKLEKNNFMTKSGKVLQHAALYKELYSIVENRQVQVIKVKGHQQSNRILTCQEKIFSVLDKLSRKKLRLEINPCIDTKEGQL